MKNMNLIYAATDAASNFARASNQISLILSKYLDKGEGRYTEEKAIEEIKKCYNSDCKTGRKFKKSDFERQFKR